MGTKCPLRLQLVLKTLLLMSQSDTSVISYTCLSHTGNKMNRYFLLDNVINNEAMFSKCDC